MGKRRLPEIDVASRLIAEHRFALKQGPARCNHHASEKQFPAPSVYSRSTTAREEVHERGACMALAKAVK
jgi:hypothetical protein